MLVSLAVICMFLCCFLCKGTRIAATVFCPTASLKEENRVKTKMSWICSSKIGLLINIKNELQTHFLSWFQSLPLIPDASPLFTFRELLEHLSTHGCKEKRTNDCSKNSLPLRFAPLWTQRPKLTDVLMKFRAKEHWRIVTGHKAERLHHHYRV